MQAQHGTPTAAGRHIAHLTIGRLRSGVAERECRGERGASMAEYALLLAFVFIAALLTISLFGDSVVALFDFATTTFQEAPNVSSS